jgi:Protein of unknown function (DUF3800)
MLRMFIDEVGNHDMKPSDDPNKRYLGLVGVIMDLDYEQKQFTADLNSIKQDIFGRDDFPLHRRELIDKTPEPFTALKDDAVREKFNNQIMALIDKALYRVITAVIDKKEHRERYAVWQFQPYHYCMTVMLERYVLHLERVGTVGDVLAESRGKKENKQLAKSYRRLYERGTDHVPAGLFQKRLTSKEIKIKPKSDNICGLQLTDLLANPACRYLICFKTKSDMTAVFGRKIVEILYRKKYLKNPSSGKVSGWGTKWLP